ncbi:MAG: sigma-70 family RNA polymerase sigma factor [Rikenellaceae bacterium]|nr:sigma-70 family RNA polymerase sigma factor [Rikenellaceae bacterium]
MHDRIRYEALPEPLSRDFDMDFAEALKILSQPERAVMLLFFMENKTVEQIAKITEYPAGTVKSHLSRGKKKLKVFFENTAVRPAVTGK